MKCVTCSSTDSSFLKLQTYVDNNTLKEISLVLPEFEIPTTQGPVYVCVTCQEQVTTFYQIKTASLKNLYHLNLYKDNLKTTSDIKFNDLKIIIENNIIPTKQDFKLNLNCRTLSDDENHLIERVSNLSHDKEIKNQRPSEEKRFKCLECDKAFSRRHYLEIHSHVHTGVRPYKCPTCQKTFTQCSALSHHKVIHTGKKSHECEVCHKTFTQKTSLIRHKQSHSNERPYQCAVCNKTFTRPGHLGDHMRSHTGENLHHCHVCQYKCARAANLKRHMRTHTGEKPYTCELCQTLFTQSSSLKDHQRRFHNNEHLS